MRKRGAGAKVSYDITSGSSRKKQASVFIILTAVLLTPVLAAVLSCCSRGASNGVTIGKNGFLFGDSYGGYDYTADYKGELAFTDDELQKIYGALNKRQTAYANNNISYLIAVIPNSQTVYSEYMTGCGAQSDNTRLKQLTAYLSEKGFDSFLNLTDALAAAKGKGQLYDNTDNTINARGAYYAYAAIFESLPENVRKKHTPVTGLVEKVKTEKTEGLALAKLAGNDILNNTVSLTLNDEEAYYTVMGNAETLVSTYVKIGYKNLIPTVPALLIDYSKASDLDAFLPYFSSTYGSVGYKANYNFSASAINSIAPKAIIQLVYEDRLATLLDDKINSTYNVALKPGDDPTTTMTPVLLSKVMTDSNTACLIGTAEAGSVITVSGSTFEPFEAQAQYERFFIPIKLGDGASDTVTLTAKVEGKAVSSTLEVGVAYAKSAALTVFAGKGSQLHYPDTLADYYCTNLFNQSTLDNIEKKLMKKLEKIRAASGKNTKLIFLIPPDAITAYPETATDEMVAKKTSDYSRLMQIEDQFADNPDIIIINLTDIILANKDKGKLFYQTDTHWNTLGSYFGYYQLMKVISEDFPAAAPRELSEYKIFQQYDSGGDLVNFLGVDPGTVTEYKTYCVPNFVNRATLTNYFDGSTNFAYSDQIKCVVDNPDLPNAIMITDSFGANLFDFVSDAFGVLVRQTMWEYKTDLDLIADVKPDYYIQVMVERNMANLYVG